jgi:hypothetical protein
MLSEADQRRYLMLLCLRCCNCDVTLQDAECAFQMRISDSEYAATKALLIARGMIDETNHPLAWEKRQYQSDTSKHRVSRHRAKKKETAKQECNVTVTAPDTEADTETDTETEIITHTQQEAARVGEVAVGHGVFINCETIRHEAFTISIPAIECLTLGKFPRDEIRAKAQGHALQWASEIESGKRPELVVPAKIANFLTASLNGEETRQQCADVRKTRAENGPKAFAKESDRERRAKIFEKLEREGRI